MKTFNSVSKSQCKIYKISKPKLYTCSNVKEKGKLFIKSDIYYVFLFSKAQR